MSTGMTFVQSHHIAVVAGGVVQVFGTGKPLQSGHIGHSLHAILRVEAAYVLFVLFNRCSSCPDPPEVDIARGKSFCC